MRERVSVCVCVCERERERERGGGGSMKKNQIGMDEITTNSYGGRLRLLI